MATLAELQDRLARLEQARGSGVRSVTFSDGRSVVYRNDDELAAQLADIRREIAAVDRKPVRQIRFSSSKGV